MTHSAPATSRRTWLPRAGAAAFLLPLILALGCAGVSPYREGLKYMEDENWDQAVLAFSKALAQKPGDISYKTALSRARLRASLEHFERGKKYLAADQLEAAMAELQQTVLLDPSNQYATNELSKAIAEYQKRKGEEPSDIELMKEKAKLEGRVAPRLNPRSNIPIALRFKDETVKKVYEALSKASGINFLYDERVDFGKKVTVDLNEVSFAKALDVLMAQNKHFYKVWDENTILIADDNQQKHKEYDDLVIQTFYLSNADVKDVQVLLRTLLDARQLAQNDRLNAITIRDTPERVEVAGKIIESNDKAKSELIVDVQLLELNRNLLQTLGIDLSAKSTSISYTGGESVPLNNLGLLNQLGNYALGPIPSVIVNFLKSDADARVIAKPQVRVSEGEKASLKIGDRIPIPTTTFNTATTGGGVFAPITSFTYQNVGINIDLEPRVHHNKEITLKLKVELSALSGSVAAPGGLTQPIIGTREIETQIRLKDGETNLLAGLIRESERKSLSSVPGLGHIPILKYLFGSTETQIEQTDIVLTLTPHIIRVPDITAEDLKPLWIGTDQDVGLRGVSRTSPFGSVFSEDGGGEEGAAGVAAAAEGQEESPSPAGVLPVPAVPVRPNGTIPAPNNGSTPAPSGRTSTNTTGGGPTVPPGTTPEPAPPAPPSPAAINFAPPSILAHVGDVINVQIVITNATRVGSVPFHVAYDPAILRFVPPALEGDFLKRDGASTIFNAQASTQNEVFVALSRLGAPTGISDGGVLCSLSFEALAAGNSQMTFTQASVLDPQGQPLPANFSGGLQVMIQEAPR